MTIKKIIEQTDKLKPNTFDFDVKLLWINQVYSKIQSEILCVPVESQKLFEGEDEEIIIPFSYLSVYIYYLLAMIDMLRGEYEKYKMSADAYNREMSNYAKYVQRGAK